MFQTYWQAGYEGADHINGHGLPLAPNSLNGHLAQADDDYAALAPFGITTVRESAGWRLCTTGGRTDFTSLDGRLAAAQRRGLQVVWTLCHYGMPEGTDVLDPGFASAFARFAGAAASHIAAYERGATYVLINEPSFFSWALSATNLMGDCPGYRGRGYDIKRQLIAAIISGIEAVRRADPAAKFLHVDPIIHVSAPDRPAALAAAALERASQFQAWDMATGRTEPQLGGSSALVDCIGVNYYHSNQWEHGSSEPYFWHTRDPRRVPFSSLLVEMWARYRRPLLVAETSHVGVGRGEWLGEIAAEVEQARLQGADVRGICLYPILDRVDWQDTSHWHRSGLWDVVARSGCATSRQLDCFYARDFLRLQGRAADGPGLPAVHSGINLAILAFCPVRWFDAPLRVRSVMSALAAIRSVLFVEEPVADATAAWLEETNPAPNVRVLTPHLAPGQAGFGASPCPDLQRLLLRYFARDPVPVEVLWLYAPIAASLAAAWPAARVVNDDIAAAGMLRGEPLLVTMENDHA